MYAYVGTLRGEKILTLKLEPSYGDAMRQEYKGIIIAGYYMNKIHWNTIFLGKELPKDFIKSLLDCSYKILLDSFSKKKKREILGK